MLAAKEFVEAKEGNISALDEQGRLYITAHQSYLENLRWRDIIHFQLFSRGELNDTNPPKNVSSEYPLHRQIYDSRRDVRAVVHAHPIYATTYAFAGKPLPDVPTEYSKILGEIAMVPLQPPGSENLAGAIVPFAQHDSFILMGHGAVTIGKNLPDALERMLTLEKYARICYNLKSNPGIGSAERE